MKIKDIAAFAGRIAPIDSADEWDNVGLLAGDADASVDKVLLALDITPAVVKEARAIGAGLIISHHPVIFEPLRALEPGTAPYLLAKYDVAALCLDTNLDRAERGVNTALADAMGLRNRAFYPAEYLLVGEPEQPMEADAFAAFIKERLGAPDVRYTGGRVTKVAVSSGGGGEGVERCTEYGCDAFVTGELKHHQYLFAAEKGIAAFDAGHYATENVVIRPLCDLLAQEFPDVAFCISEKNGCPYKTV